MAVIVRDGQFVIDDFSNQEAEPLSDSQFGLDGSYVGGGPSRKKRQEIAIPENIKAAIRAIKTGRASYIDRDALIDFDRDMAEKEMKYQEQEPDAANYNPYQTVRQKYFKQMVAARKRRDEDNRLMRGPQ